MTEGNISENSRRIARNTVLLYFRMFLMLLVGLYTSRVVLNALGQDDFGIYGAVGGVVALFGILTGSLAGAISRFLAYEMGKEEQRLEEVFSTTVLVQAVMALLVLLVAEGVGIWFLNAKMVIPDGRMEAANWVLQCSILMFVVNMLAVPYNAAIIAHEKMDAFAYIGIVEAMLQLGVALVIRFSSSDRLVLYAVLMLAAALFVRFLYSWYAHRHFSECRFRLRRVDRSFVKQIASYASWTFLGNGASVLNAQGINILMNLFFGVRVNAARDVSVKLEGNVSRFIFNITTAINPQINKSYAAGRLAYMHELVCKGAKYSFFLFYFFAMPLILEAPALLELWLGQVPKYAVEFVRISLLSSLFVAIGNPFTTGIFATGDVKRYQIVASVTNVMAFPLAYAAFKLGSSPTAAYWMVVGTSILVLVERIWMACRQIRMPFGLVFRELIWKALRVSAVALIVPTALCLLQEPSVWRAVEVVLSGFAMTALSAFFLGTTPGERAVVVNAVKKKLK